MQRHVVLALFVASTFAAYCGHNCTSNSDCQNSESQAQCSYCLSGYCTVSCGQSCKGDSDCSGPDPTDAGCSICTAGSCVGPMSGNCWTPPVPDGIPQKPAPRLPDSWNATVKYTNYTDGSTDEGKLWYDYTYKAARFDFGRCPFHGVVDPTLDQSVNDGPCNVLFYKGLFGYNYPSVGSCCLYYFPVWTPSSFQQNETRYLGTIELPLGTADVFDFTYECDWTKKPNPSPLALPAYTVQRRIYLQAGSNVPYGLNETLTSSVNRFTTVAVGPQDESVFSSIANDKSCRVQGDDPNFDYYCTHYAGQGILTYLGYA